MRKLLLLTTALLINGGGCGEAISDTISIGFLDFNQTGSGVTTLAVSGQPIVQLLPPTPGQPLFLGSGWGFAQIIAMVIPPGGNQISGGLGGPAPTFQFSFNDGFTPPQGGLLQLYATWQGTITGGDFLSLPTRFASDEMPAGDNRLRVVEQIFICSVGQPFCDDSTVGGGTLVAQDRFTDVTGVHLGTFTGFAPGQPFAITEVFSFSGPGLPSAQGNVGATIMTTPVAVPGPIVGTGPAAVLLGFFLLGLGRWRRKRAKNAAPETGDRARQGWDRSSTVRKLSFAG
jgi:hypothetical protein